MSDRALLEEVIGVQAVQIATLKGLLREMLDHWFENFYDGAPDAGELRESFLDQRIATSYDTDADDWAKFASTDHTRRLRDIARAS